MAKKLTKELLQGMEFTEEIEVELQGQPFKIEIRPLNGPEAEKVEAEMQAGTDMKGRSGKGGKMEQSMTMDMQKNTKGRKNSDILACAYGTTDEEFTQDFIKTVFPNDLIKQVAKRVKEISGIGNQADVENFRDGQGSEQPAADEAENAGNDKE